MRRPFGPSFSSDPAFPTLKAQIVARTGHHYYTDKDDLLFDRLRRRFKASGAADCAAYRDLLARDEAEWIALEAEITIGETFFFRYAEQFAALRETILPGLIAARQADRSLRIWSAGCSTGAEPYSIAILLHELLGDALPAWDLHILGTDISAAALATARAAEYGRWALRTMPPGERLARFRFLPAAPGATREGGYALRPEFQRLVRFERQNLLGLIDGTAPRHLDAFDLILCRNVLIYFDTETVAGIMRGLGRRLRSGGWLLIGHAEPNPAFSGWLSAVSLPGTVAYRRPEDGVPANMPAQVPAPFAPWQAFPVPPASGPLVTPEAATEPDRSPTTVPVVPPRRAVPTLAPAMPDGDAPVAEFALDARESLDAVRALADGGNVGEAWRVLRGALAAHPTESGLRYYEGLLARSLGRDAEAERALRAALYLDGAFVMAHYHLGLLLGALGRPVEARRALDNAIRLSQALPPDTPLREGDGAVAGEVAASAALARIGMGRGAA